MIGEFWKHTLVFNFPAGTSRGVLKSKDSWIIQLQGGNRIGYGECSLIPGLSPDDPERIEEVLELSLRKICNGNPLATMPLEDFPAVRFGLECALQDLNTEGTHRLFPSSFLDQNAGIPINGLIWMGDKSFMLEQVKQKLAEGFRCLKLKIGAINFDTELDILEGIRNEFEPHQLELRVDANGAFTINEVQSKLNQLAQYSIHSIEQPITPGNWPEMAEVCSNSPIPVALDEELIGLPEADILPLLETTNPAYIILKPSLLGGLKASRKWIEAAEKREIGWWVTSALESNIGLNAIAQFCASLNTIMPQGLGTGKLFENNYPSPLKIKDAHLYYESGSRWNIQHSGEA